MDEIPLDSKYVSPPNVPKPWVDLKVKVKNFPSRYDAFYVKFDRKEFFFNLLDIGRKTGVHV